MILPTIVLLLANILCVFLARRMAQDRAKPPTAMDVARCVFWAGSSHHFGGHAREARLTSLAGKPFDLASCAHSLHEPLA